MNIFNLIPEHFIDENVYIHIDILQSCYDAIDEGVIDPSIVDIARNNSTSMIASYLDRSFYLLDKFYESFIVYLNNFILNYAKLAEKYKSTIIDMYSKISEPVVYNTYTYPKQRDKYPRPLNINAKWYQLVADAKLFDTDDTQEKQDVNLYFNVKVNNALQEFTQSYLGKKLNVNKLEQETKTYTNITLKGPQKTIGLTEANVSDIINNIVSNAKDTQKELKSVKAAYTKDYKTLQEVLGLTDNKKIPFGKALDMITKPQQYAFEKEELKRFSNINMEINRLLTGLVTVYSTVFSTKLTVMRERIDMDRVVLVALLQAAGSFAAINNKTATKQSQPLKRVEPIDKFML